MLDVHDSKVDVVAGLSFSYSVFKKHDLLRRYFAQVRASLNPGAILFLDAFGGMEAVSELNEKRKIDPTTAFNGTKVPSFTYFWEQERFNPLDHADRGPHQLPYARRAQDRAGFFLRLATVDAARVAGTHDRGRFRLHRGVRRWLG